MQIIKLCKKYKFFADPFAATCPVTRNSRQPNSSSVFVKSPGC